MIEGGARLQVFFTRDERAEVFEGWSSFVNFGLGCEDALCGSVLGFLFSGSSSQDHIVV